MSDFENYAESRTRKDKDGQAWVAVDLLGPSEKGMVALAVPLGASLPAAIWLVELERTEAENKKIEEERNPPRIIRPG